MKDVQFSFGSFKLATSATKGEMDHAASNLIRASVNGAVDVHKVVTGSFHGEWGAAAAGCKAGPSAPCAQGVVNAKFRVKFF